MYLVITTSNDLQITLQLFNKVAAFHMQTIYQSNIYANFISATDRLNFRKLRKKTAGNNLLHAINNSIYEMQLKQLEVVVIWHNLSHAMTV